MSQPATELLSYARQLMDADGPSETALWARCSALLTRQALEAALDEWWNRHVPGVADGSRRSQLLCLGDYLGDDRLAADVAQAWAALSRACHYHWYELAPTAGELGVWMDVVSKFTQATSSRRATGR